MSRISIEDDSILWIYEGDRKVLFWDACSFRPSLKSSIQNRRLPAEIKFEEVELRGIGDVWLPLKIICEGKEFTNVRLKTG